MTPAGRAFSQLEKTLAAEGSVSFGAQPGFSAMMPNLARVLAAVGATLTFVVTASAVFAEQSFGAPVKGARYIGEGEVYSVELRVAKSGRSLVARRSVVQSMDCPGADIHLGSPARPVRISRSGRFRYERNRGRFIVTATGVFRAGGKARVTIAFRERSPRFRGFCEKAAPEKVSLRRIVPFRDCRTHPGKTVLRGPAGRVFLNGDYDAFGCLYSVDRRFYLGPDFDGDPDVGLYRLAGPYVAYMEFGCEGIDSCLSDVIVRDLRNGKKVFEGQRAADFDFVTDVALKATGSVAWIAGPAVWASDTQGVRLLDTGNIAKRSLDLSGSTLTWLKDGALGTATLE